jgi:CRISPR-associated helicase Cas3/CRISPR-associated endonuclease Cas3-HD
MLAHISEDGIRKQSLEEHLLNTARLAEEFGKQFGAGEIAYNTGIGHDIGKCSDEFQKRITGQGGKCDHSTAGAKEVYIDFGLLGKLMSYAIAGHHSGLMDSGTPGDVSGGTLYARLNAEIPDYKSKMPKIEFKKIENPPSIFNQKESDGFSFAFFTRMIYSCLTDADFLDTENFMTGERPACKYDFDEMLSNLNKKLKSFQNPQNPVCMARNEIQESCIEAAKSPPGLFSLTVPTGAGKTLSSVAFALNHLKKNDLRRIIYVIPYTSIIEQTAAIFSADDLFGNKNVLQHYSGYDYSGDDDDFNEVKRLAAENWDMPIIVTTNVQFFESLFAAKSSKCRKLHNIAKSVIIFDEVQMFPVEFLLPCVRAIAELVKNYGCTALLCSATQPALNQYFESYGLSAIEISQNIEKYRKIFKRCEIEITGEKDIETLSKEILELKQCLVIVNTKTHAKELYEKVKGDGSFHLSTWMYPKHRKRIIDEIRERLKNGVVCRVISTRLVEAGVDFDFPVVYRAKAGIDSIIQSAGRCNREGKLKNENGEPAMGKVIVFETEEKYNLKLSPFKRQLAAAESVMNKYSSKDIASNEAVEEYFKELYFTEGDGLDLKNVIESFNKGYDLRTLKTQFKTNEERKNRLFNFPFKEIAEKFKLIDDNSYGVIIPIEEECKKLVGDLKSFGVSRNLLRSLQKYTVNVYENERENLLGGGNIKEICGLYVLEDVQIYNDATGLDTKIESGAGIFC